MKLEYPNGEPSELVKAGFRKKFRFSLEKVRNRKLANLKNQITRRKTNEDADPPKKRKKNAFFSINNRKITDFFNPYEPKISKSSKRNFPPPKFSENPKKFKISETEKIDAEYII